MKIILNHFNPVTMVIFVIRSFKFMSEGLLRSYKPGYRPRRLQSGEESPDSTEQCTG